MQEIQQKKAASIVKSPQLLGCKCKERPLLASPSSLPSSLKQQNRRAEQNGYNSSPICICVSILSESMSLHLLLQVPLSAHYLLSLFLHSSLRFFYYCIIFFICISTFYLLVCYLYRHCSNIISTLPLAGRGRGSMYFNNFVEGEV